MDGQVPRRPERAPVLRPAHHPGQGPPRQGHRAGREAQGDGRLSAESRLPGIAGDALRAQGRPGQGRRRIRQGFRRRLCHERRLRPDRLRQFLDRSGPEPRERRRDGRHRRRGPWREEGLPVLLLRTDRRHLRQAQKARQGPGHLRARIRQEELGRPDGALELRRFLEPPGHEPRQRRRSGPATPSSSRPTTTTTSPSARSCSS